MKKLIQVSLFFICFAAQAETSLEYWEKQQSTIESNGQQEYRQYKQNLINDSRQQDADNKRYWDNRDQQDKMDIQLNQIKEKLDDIDRY